MKEAIKVAPQYSLSYWVLAELYFISGQKILEQKFRLKAYKINPLLKIIAFENLQIFYVSRNKGNSLLVGLYDLIKILEKIPTYIAPYQYYGGLSLLDKENVNTTNDLKNSVNDVKPQNAVQVNSKKK